MVGILCTQRRKRSVQVPYYGPRTSVGGSSKVQLSGYWCCKCGCSVGVGGVNIKGLGERLSGLGVTTENFVGNPIVTVSYINSEQASFQCPATELKKRANNAENIDSVEFLRESQLVALCRTGQFGLLFTD